MRVSFCVCVNSYVYEHLSSVCVCVCMCVCAHVSVYGCSMSAIGGMWLNSSLYKNERNDKKQKDFDRNAAYAQYVP